MSAERDEVAGGRGSFYIYFIWVIAVAAGDGEADGNGNGEADVIGDTLNDVGLYEEYAELVAVA